MDLEKRDLCVDVGATIKPSRELQYIPIPILCARNRIG